VYIKRETFDKGTTGTDKAVSSWFFFLKLK